MQDYKMCSDIYIPVQKTHDPNALQIHGYSTSMPISNNQ